MFKKKGRKEYFRLLGHLIKGEVKISFRRAAVFRRRQLEMKLITITYCINYCTAAYSVFTYSAQAYLRIYGTTLVARQHFNAAHVNFSNV